MSRDATADKLAAMQQRALRDGVLRIEPDLTPRPSYRRLTPQNICRHSPCFCGLAPRHGFDPYDAEKAAKWMTDREAARSRNAPLKDSAPLEISNAGGSLHKEEA